MDQRDNKRSAEQMEAARKTQLANDEVGIRAREPLSALEKHYTVQDLADRWQRAPNTIRKLFQHEAGVISISLGTGQRASLSIPESVLARVYERLRDDSLKAALPRHRPLRVVRLCDLDAGVSKQPRHVLKRNAA